MTKHQGTVNAVPIRDIKGGLSNTMRDIQIQSRQDSHGTMKRHYQGEREMSDQGTIRDNGFGMSDFLVFVREFEGRSPSRT